MLSGTWGRSAPSLRPFTIRIACVAVVLASTALASATRPAHADEWDDVRIPEHSWSSLAGTGHGLLNRDVVNDRGDNRRVTNAGTDLRLRGFAAHDGERLQWSVDASVLGFGGRTEERRRIEYSSPGAYFLNDVHALSRSLNERLDLSASMRRYQGELPVAIEIAAAGVAFYNQVWSRQRNNGANLGPGGLAEQFNGNGDESWRYQYNARLLATVGVGRVRDVTGLLDARVLEDRLRATGALTRPLSAAARQKLAALFYVGPRYSAAHDRPDRFLWKDIEAILRDDGALAGEGLGALSVLRARETYQLPGIISPVARSKGFFVGPTLAGTHDHRILRDEVTSDMSAYQDGVLVGTSVSSTSARLETDADYLAAGIRGEVHRPIGWRWQIDARGQALFPVVNAEQGLNLSAFADADYLIADRWQATLFVAIERHYLTPEDGATPAVDQWTSYAGASLAWYVEDRTTLFATVQENQDRGAGFFATGPFESFQRHASLQLGVSYRFSGRLEAPGLIGPVTRL